MDVDTSARLARLERRQRWLMLGVGLLSAVTVAQAAGWLSRGAAAVETFREIHAERIVVARSEESLSSMELSPKAMIVRHVGGATQRAELGTDGLVLSSLGSGQAWLRPAVVELTGASGGLLEMKMVGSHGTEPLVTVLGQGKQSDIGAGFAAVTGGGGSTVIDGRDAALGLRVIDAKGEVRPGPR